MVNEDEEEILSVGDSLRIVGEYGKFQRIAHGVIGFMVFFWGFQSVIMYFATIAPSWRCDFNSSTCNLIGEQSGDDLRRCNMSRVDWFYTQHKHYSLVTQFDIQCEDQWLLNLAASIHFIGFAIGSIVLGWIGDRYGCKTVLFPCSFIILVTGLVISFLPVMSLIIICRFIVGFFQPGIIVQGTILMSELVGNNQRNKVVQFLFFVYPFSYSILALKAYLLQDWRMLSIACTAPYLIVLAFYKFVPESVTWLQAKGRISEAMEVLHKIAKYNKTNLDSQILLSSVPETNALCNRPETGTNKSQVLRNILILSLLWCICGLDFFGLQFLAHELGGSMHVNFVLLALTDIPSILLAVVTGDRYGRKKTNLFPLLLGGVICVIMAAVLKIAPTVVNVALGLIAKFGVTVPTLALYVWSAEILPTHIRSIGMGILELLSRVGASCAPWVIESNLSQAIIYIIFGIPAAAAFLLGLWLPETNCRNIAEQYEPNMK